jgi:hypothetical protein
MWASSCRALVEHLIKVQVRCPEVVLIDVAPLLSGLDPDIISIVQGFAIRSSLMVSMSPACKVQLSPLVDVQSSRGKNRRVWPWSAPSILGFSDNGKEIFQRSLLSGRIACRSRLKNGWSWGGRQLRVYRDCSRCQRWRG